MQKERAVVQEHQSRNEGGHNRSAAGIHQACSRNAAKTTGANYSRNVGGTQQELSRAAAGCSRHNNKKDGRHARNPAGMQQG